MITGENANQQIQIHEYVSTQNRLAQTVDIPLEKDIYLDRNTYFEYTLEGDEEITLIFYYRQLDQKDKLIPINPFINPSL